MRPNFSYRPSPETTIRRSSECGRIDRLMLARISQERQCHDVRCRKTMNNDRALGTVDHLVESIVALNPRADRSWLVTFDCYDLGRYLQHLECAGEPRESATPWRRLGDTSAIVCRTAA